jgi:hypothetical protein
VIEIYFKKLAHAPIEAEKSKLCRIGWQLETQKELMLYFQSEGSLLAELPLLLKSVFLY